MDNLSISQLQEWEAYDRIDPIGTWRDDFRMAFLSAVVTNLAISIHGKKGAAFKTIFDFMPSWEEEETAEPKKQTPEQMKEILMGLAKATKRVRGIKPPKSKQQ